MNTQNLQNKFIKYLENNNLSNSTITAYSTDVSQFIKNCEENTIANIKRFHIKKFLTFLEKKKITAKTRSRKINSLKKFFDFCIKNEIINTNPCDQIDYPEIKKQKQRVLSENEINNLIEKVRDNKRLFVMINLLLQTGIRISELSKLKIKDYIEEDRKIFITQHSSQPKREIPLNDKILYILKDYFSEHPFKNDSNFPFFYTNTRKHINIRNLRSSIDRAIEKAKISNASVNDLRNTFIVKQLEFGNSIEFVGKIVGHTSKAATKRYLDLVEGKYKNNGVDRIGGY